MLNNQLCKTTDKTIYQIGCWQVNPQTNELIGNETTTRIEPKAMDVLMYLMKHQPKVISTDELLAQVWGEIVVTANTVRRIIAQLRKVLDDKESSDSHIRTIPKAGYQLVAEVKRLNPQTNKLTSSPKKFTKAHYLLLALGLIFALTLLWFWQPGSKIAPFTTSTGVEPITVMPAKEWAPRYALNDQWISYLYQNEGSGQFQLFMQSTTDNKPYNVLSSNGIISSYSWLGTSDKLVIAEFINKQCLLKLYQFNASSKQLAFIKTIEDCGIKPIYQLTYSQFNQSLYWLYQSDTGLNSSSRLKLVSLASVKPDKRKKSLPEIDNIYVVAASPDGRQLAFLRQFQWEYSDIYLYDIAEHRQQKLLSGQPFIQSLSWSRQGKQILYVSDNQLTFLSPDSRTLPLGFSSENIIKDAYFSPKGEQLLYVSDTGRYQLQSLSLLAPDKPTPVSWGSSQNERNPAFANDGKQLAFITNRNGKYRIWIRSANGDSYPLQTNELALDQTLIRWSANDRYLLFHSANALYRYDLTTDSYKKLTPDEIYADVVGWSYRQPKQVYFRSDKGGQFNIWRLNTETLTMTKLTTDGGFSGHESKDGRYFYYTKKNRDGLWRIDLDNMQENLEFTDFEKENYLSWWLFEDGIYYLHGEHGAGLYWWSFSQKEFRQLWQMPPKHHGGFAVSRELKTVIFAIKPLEQWNIMQLKGF